jgi:hypothetical protein
MKKIILAIVIFVLNATMLFSQQVEISELESATVTGGKFESYLSKDGTTYKVGDFLDIGLPSGTNGRFVLIQQIDIAGNILVVGSNAINTHCEIKKIRVVGNKRQGYKVQLQTKGSSSIDNYFFNLEDAIVAGEIKSKGMTSDEAMKELKTAKDKLDLGLITQAEYDKIKAELIKYIK